MKFRILFALALAGLFVADAEGGPFRRRVQSSGGCSQSAGGCSSCASGAPATSYKSGSPFASGSSCASGSCSVQPSGTAAAYAMLAGVTTGATTGEATDALAEVNAKRAARGLRPFAHDPLLTAAAERCAAFRANYRHPNGAVGLFGHTSNDFAFLQGASASAAGCAAYPASYGFLACCVYENYTYAGAASVMGADGRMYHHLFVRR